VSRRIHQRGWRGVCQCAPRAAQPAQQRWCISHP
jgi:hypothetical protein